MAVAPQITSEAAQEHTRGCTGHLKGLALTWDLHNLPSAWIPFYRGEDKAEILQN